MSRFHVVTVSEDARTVQVGQVRFLHTGTPGGKASIVVRGDPPGDGALLGLLVMDPEEWFGMVNALGLLARYASPEVTQ